MIGSNAKIDTPIEIKISLGNQATGDNTCCVIKLDAGFEVHAEGKIMGGKAIISVQDIEPDQYVGALLEDVPKFLRLIADKIERESVRTVGDLLAAIWAKFGDRVQASYTYKGNWIGGYHFTLRNGFDVSVQFAPGMFADYKNWMFDKIGEGHLPNELFESEQDFSDSTTAEVAVIRRGEWYNPMIGDKYDADIDDVQFAEYVAAADVMGVIERFMEML